MKKIKIKLPKAKIVIGAGYGDEGKGLTVNELCKKGSNSIVIRFSGGQQAGHTVHYEGKQHTFSNFGAGTFKGIPTYFTEHTTFYPIGIKYEAMMLENMGVETPNLYIHPLAKMTTPWDVFENRACETNLANGSCGQGVGKTMKRNEGPYKLYAIDLSNPTILKDKLASIEKNYYARGFENSPELEKEVEEFLDAIKPNIIRIDTYERLLEYKTLIFEGSQGIMLDMDHGVFPNVTYSNTTSKNAMKVCDILGIKKREIFLVTRAYSTRHGKGDGTYTGEPIVLKNNEGETNINNKYQGEFLTSKLNYGRLDYALLIEKLYSYQHKLTLVVTCCNQTSEEFHVNKLEYPSIIDDILFSHSPEGNFKKIKTIHSLSE